jgi:Carbohydrate family 9 binding domain-like
MAPPAQRSPFSSWLSFWRSTRLASAAGRGARVAALVVLGALGGLAGCVDRGEGPKLGDDPALVERSRLTQEPAALEHRVDAALASAPRRGAAPRPGQAAAAGDGAQGADPDGAQVIYLGAIVEADTPDGAPLTTLEPGQAIRIRHFWKVLAPLSGELRVFTHLLGQGGEGGASSFMNLDDSPMRRAYPPRRWRAGDLFTDAQSFVLRPDWRSPTATLLVGLVKRGGHGPADRLAVVRGPGEGGAVVARVLPVDVSRAPPPPGTVRVVRASSPITVDGLGEEAAWAAVPWSANFATAEGSRDPVGSAAAKLTWDAEHLYALIHVEDSDVASPYKQADDPLWKADCVELFIDADSNRRQYVELQVNPHNAQFDSYFATTRAQPGDTTFAAGMKSAVVVRGTAAEAGDLDGGWDVELAIPWAALRGKDPAMAVRLPPEPGDQMRLNVVRVDKRAEDKYPTASAWNRITYADFHALDRMLTAVFVEAPAPAAAAAAPPTPSTPAAPGAAAPSAPPPSPPPAEPRSAPTPPPVR